MKKSISLVAVLFLGGCATIGKAPAPMPVKVNHLPLKPHYPIIEKKPVVVPPVVAAPEQPAPTFKKRWYSKFRVHPRWFHD